MQTIAFVFIAGFNGLVEYGIISGNARGHFMIRPDSGVITVRKSLVNTSHAIHELSVVAYDLAPPSDRLWTYTNISIILSDVNDVSFELVMPSYW